MSGCVMSHEIYVVFKILKYQNIILKCTYFCIYCGAKFDRINLKMLDNVFYLRKSYLSCRRFEIMHSFLILKTNYILFYQSLFKCHSVPGACAVDRLVCSGKAKTGPGRSSLRTGSR